MTIKSILKILNDSSTNSKSNEINDNHITHKTIDKSIQIISEDNQGYAGKKTTLNAGNLSFLVDIKNNFVGSKYEVNGAATTFNIGFTSGTRSTSIMKYRDFMKIQKEINKMIAIGRIKIPVKVRDSFNGLILKEGQVKLPLTQIVQIYGILATIINKLDRNLHIIDDIKLHLLKDERKIKYFTARNKNIKSKLPYCQSRSEILKFMLLSIGTNETPHLITINQFSYLNKNEILRNDFIDSTKYYRAQNGHKSSFTNKNALTVNFPSVYDKNIIINGHNARRSARSKGNLTPIIKRIKDRLNEIINVEGNSTIKWHDLVKIAEDGTISHIEIDKLIEMENVNILKAIMDLEIGYEVEINDIAHFHKDIFASRYAIFQDNYGKILDPRYIINKWKKYTVKNHQNYLLGLKTQIKIIVEDIIEKTQRDQAFSILSDIKNPSFTGMVENIESMLTRERYIGLIKNQIDFLKGKAKILRRGAVGRGAILDALDELSHIRTSINEKIEIETAIAEILAKRFNFPNQSISKMKLLVRGSIAKTRLNSKLKTIGDLRKLKGRPGTANDFGLALSALSDLTDQMQTKQFREINNPRPIIEYLDEFLDRLDRENFNKQRKLLIKSIKAHKTADFRGYRIIDTMMMISSIRGGYGDNGSSLMISFLESLIVNEKLKIIAQDGKIITINQIKTKLRNISVKFTKWHRSSMKS